VVRYGAMLRKRSRRFVSAVVGCCGEETTAFGSFKRDHGIQDDIDVKVADCDLLCRVCGMLVLSAAKKRVGGGVIGSAVEVSSC
jgi:hypothetical protein